jgi:hypothetical protein
MILPVKTIDRVTCKALFQQASGHHQLFRYLKIRPQIHLIFKTFLNNNFRHYKERESDRDGSKYSFKYFERQSTGISNGRESKRDTPGMFTDKR